MILKSPQFFNWTANAIKLWPNSKYIRHGNMLSVSARHWFHSLGYGYFFFYSCVHRNDLTTSNFAIFLFCCKLLCYIYTNHSLVDDFVMSLLRFRFYIMLTLNFLCSPFIRQCECVHKYSMSTDHKDNIWFVMTESHAFSVKKEKWYFYCICRCCLR